MSHPRLVQQLQRLGLRPRPEPDAWAGRRLGATVVVLWGGAHRTRLEAWAPLDAAPRPRKPAASLRERDWFEQTRGEALPAHLRVRGRVLSQRFEGEAGALDSALETLAGLAVELGGYWTQARLELAEALGGMNVALQILSDGGARLQHLHPRAERAHLTIDDAPSPEAVTLRDPVLGMLLHARGVPEQVDALLSGAVHGPLLSLLREENAVVEDGLLQVALGRPWVHHAERVVPLVQALDTAWASATRGQA